MKALLLFVIGMNSAFAEPLHFNLGRDLNPKAIIGGTEVSQADIIASSTVLLVGKENGGTFTCTGIIVDNDMILTAAHCVGQFGNAPIVVAFRTAMDGPGPIIPAMKRTRPSDFLQRVQSGDTNWHDVALLQLNQPIPAGYRPAKLLDDDSVLKNGALVTLAGYGMSVPVAPPEGAQIDDGSGVLRKVNQTILKAAYSETELSVSLANGRGSCHGDSGGPVFIQKGKDLYVAGVASRMTDLNRVAHNNNERDFSCSVEMVYTKVTAIATWIQGASAALRAAK